MKKLMSFLLLCCFILISSCASEQKVEPKKSAWGKTRKQPCTEYSDGSYFAGMGIAKAQKKEDAKNTALADAQKFCAMLMKHSYQGMISDFMQSMGHNNARDIESKISMAGDRIIKAELEDSTPTCLEYSEETDDYGNIEAYISIRINKKELAKKIAKEVDNSLTLSEKDQINYDEKTYREEMEKRFREDKGEAK